jgi:hypothetical protein
MEMNVLRLAVGFALVVGLAGCGGSGKDGATKTVMPNVKDRQLDVALSDIKRAGFEDKVEVTGGGTFGIIKKSNWKVCEQLPAAGQAITSSPRLTVDRSCDSAVTGSTAPPTSTVPPTTVPRTTVPATTVPRATVPPRTVPPQTQPPATQPRATQPPATQPVSFYYANCAAARSAGAAPLHRGDPGYSPSLDRDGDGIACE